MIDNERTAVEMSSLSGFARGLGLDDEIVRDIYGAVGREAAAAGGGDDDCMAKVRKRMLVAAR